MLRVTFDTNTLDLACRPERSPKNPLQPRLPRVHEALQEGVLQGFYSLAMLTIEGVPRVNRADTFSTTQMTPSHEARASSIMITYAVDQTNRPPLPQPVIDRVIAAHDAGLRALKSVPRIGLLNYRDPTGDYFLSNGVDEAMSRWQSTAIEVARAIDARGVGFSQLHALGANLALSKPGKTWFEALSDASDIHQERAIERAFGEWADGDTIASHIAYGIDIFCSDDAGKSNANPSILDATQKEWLAAAYGVRLMTFEELLDELHTVWPQGA